MDYPATPTNDEILTINLLVPLGLTLWETVCDCPRRLPAV